MAAAARWSASITSTRPDWFPQKKVTVPFQIALERDPDFPDVPALGEFAKDARTRQVLELVVAPYAMDKPVLLPPGVPPSASLCSGEHSKPRSPIQVSSREAQRQRVQMEPVTSNRVHQILDAAYAMPADVVKAANEALNITGDAAN